MRHIISTFLLSLFIFPISYPQALSPQERGFYLLDTLSLTKLQEGDSILLDSCLKSFHKVETKLEKIEALETICENMAHNDWERYQGYLHNLLTIELGKKTDPKTVKSLQKSFGKSHHNLGNIKAGQGLYDESQAHYEKSIELAEQVGDRASVAEAMAGLGNIYYRKGDLESAIETFLKVESIQTSIDDQEGLVLTGTALGIFNQIQGNIPLALENHLKALSIAEQIGYKKGIGSCLGNIGTLYSRMGDEEEALKFMEKALVIRRELGDPYSIDLALRNIGSLLMGQKKHSEATKIFKESIALNTKLGQTKALAQAYLNMGIILTYQDSLDEALPLFEMSENLSKKIDDKRGISECKREVGSIFLEKGMLPQAESNLLQSFKMANDLGFLGMVQRTTLKLSQVYQKLGNTSSELSFFRQHITARDSMQKKENVKTATRMLVKHETEKKQMLEEQKEREIAEIEFQKVQRRDRLQYSVLFFVVFIFFLVVVFSGKLKIPTMVKEGLLFFFLLLVFEFILVLTDPMLDPFTQGEPFKKLLSNAILAIAITPLHSVIERIFKSKLSTA